MGALRAQQNHESFLQKLFCSLTFINPVHPSKQWLQNIYICKNINNCKGYTYFHLIDLKCKFKVPDDFSLHDRDTSCWHKLCLSTGLELAAKCFEII